MTDKFFKAISEYSMISTGDSVLVGVSGGADSMCLLKLLFSNRIKLGISVSAAHVNHCIRGAEADSDEEYVRAFCRQHKIELHCAKIDIPKLAEQEGIGTELCARNERYRFFSSLGYSKIATAHTGSDCVETMMMNLSRGASLHGLCSIPPVRDNIIRPLIYFTRDDTERFCKENEIDFVTDSTNLTDEYTRNKFRHGVLGLIKNINVSFEQNALRCIESLRCDEDYMAQQTQRLFENAFNKEAKSLSAQVILDSHPAIAKRTLAYYFGTILGSDYEFRHIEGFYRALGSDCAVTLPSGVTVQCKNGIISEKQKCEAQYCIDEITADPKKGFDGKFGQYKIRIYCTSDCIEAEKNGDYAFDVGKITENIVIRSRRPGDTITLAKRRCTKTLKKLFCELKIPERERGNIPVFVCGNDILLVPGVGVGAKYGKTNETTQFMIIKTEVDKNDE